MLRFVFTGPPREKFKTTLIFGGKRGDRIVFMTTVVAYPVPTATWDRSVSDNSVIPINDFMFKVSAYVNITGEKSYGNYNVTIDNKGDRNLILYFVIRSEGNVIILVASIICSLSKTVEITTFNYVCFQ